MKRSVIIILFLHIILTGISQKVRLKNIKQQEFVGTWQWTRGKDTFTIKLIEDTFYLKYPDTLLHWILGWHKFVQDGKLLESSYEFTDSIKNKKTTIIGAVNKGVLICTFRDLSRDRSFRIEMKMLNRRHSKILWTSQFLEDIRINEPPSKIRGGQTVPSGIILKKIQ